MAYEKADREHLRLIIMDRNPIASYSLYKYLSLVCGMSSDTKNAV